MSVDNQITRRPAAFATALVASAIAGASPAAAQDVPATHEAHLVMEQVPASWWSYAENEAAMWLWNQIMDLFRFVADDGGFADDNGESEFVGFLTSQQVLDFYGSTPPSGWLGVEISAFDAGGTMIESDIAFNVDESWTTDPELATGGPSINYIYVALHELGHAWGMAHADTDFPSIMAPSYSSSMVQTGLTVHALDAVAMRGAYGDQLDVLPLVDMAVFSHYVDAGSLTNSGTDAAVYEPGGQLTVENVTVENIGVGAQSDVWIRLYLSTNTTISASDAPLGEWVWSAFGAETVWTGDLTGTVPADLADGTYYVGAVVSRDGFGADDNGANDSTRFYSTVEVAWSCPSDHLEPNDVWYLASPVGNSSEPDLAICAGDRDWLRFDLAPGELAFADIWFDHSAGDLDVVLYDSALGVVASSTSIADHEAVQTPVAVGYETYYLEVFGYDGATNGYSLATSVEAPCGDSYEPNDVQALASTIAEGTVTGLSICAGDEDWYRVDVSAGSALSVTAEFTHANGDLDIALYDPSSNFISASASVTDDEVVTVFPVVSPGYHYIYVYGFDGATNDYKLIINVTEVCTVPTLLASATAIGGSFGGTVGYELCLSPHRAGAPFWLVGTSPTIVGPLILSGASLPVFPPPPPPLSPGSSSAGGGDALISLPGRVGADGRAFLTLEIPPLVGLDRQVTLRVAAVLVDPATGRPEAVTESVPLTLVP